MKEMKKQFSLLTMLTALVFLAGVATSCSKDDDDDTPNLPEGVSVTPRNLDFSATGGRQSVFVKNGDFLVYGAEVRTEGKGWCGVSAAKNSTEGEIYVTVQPNTTENARECYIDFYVAEYENAADKDKIKIPVHITQQAASGGSGGGITINKEISSITISGEAAAQPNDAGQDKMSYGGRLSQSNATFTIKPNGSGAIITGESFERVYNYLYSVSITIDDWNNLSSKKAKVTNFKLVANLLQERESYGSKVTIEGRSEVNASNIPTKSYDSGYAKWESTVGNGMTLSAKTVTTTSYEGGKSSITLSSANNSANKLSIEVYFKDGSKVRLSAD